MRECARVGCHNQVKKATNKYCSRACCAIDPQRNQRLREASRRRVLPMVRQLELSIWAAEEATLEPAYGDLEGMPTGLRRLTATARR
ncbi:MAG: hypothetical protein M3010_00145 [Candidatus Dormibacteraeota bacterium]|nr:hypothetical protein [Candidatus Dormibacteraeota bacterium]